MLEKFYITCDAENQWTLDPSRADDKIIFLKDEYEKFWWKIQRGENFALSRSADGELGLMLGREMKGIDGWVASQGVTNLGKALLETLQIDDPNFYYGVSCPCCDSAAYYWYLRHTNSSNITFSDIWLNANFKAFQSDFQNLERDAVLITNWRGKDKKFGRLNVRKHYVVSDDCVKFYEEDCETLIRQIIADFGHEKNLFYVVSAGPLSCVIIAALFKNNPDNCYIDFGSATDLMTHEKVTRPYMIESTQYAHQSCWMFDRKKIGIDVDVVLTAYKRPQVLSQQLAAIKNQTLPPRRIFLYQDGIDGYYKVELNEKILNEFDAYRISETNCGVWKRFEYADEIVESPYVCIFDDDTIPGARWLENCHMNMMQQSGIYGTNGVLLTKLEKYPLKILNAGWHRPNSKTCAVDLVGHSWFFEPRCLKWMLAKSWSKKYKFVGEDMTLSVAAAEHGVGTYVPQHPEKILSLWGSIPDFGYKYGGDEAAVSVNPANRQAMQDVVKEIYSGGQKWLLEENPSYLEEFSSVVGESTAPSEGNKSDLKLIKSGATRLLPFFGKKQPVFMGEKRCAPFVKKLFALRDKDYQVLENENARIELPRLFKLLRKNSINIFFTNVYEQLKPLIEQRGFHEGKDFIDGRELLILAMD